MNRIQIIILLTVLSNSGYAMISEDIISRYPDGAKKQVEVYHHEIKLNEIFFSQKGDTTLVKDYYWGSLPFGKWKKYSRNNVVTDSGNFIIGDKESYLIDKKVNGQYCEYYPNGKIKKRTYLKDRFITDEWESYYENGNRELVADLKRDNWMGYDSTGNLTYASQSFDKYKHVFSYDSSSIAEERVYKDGKRIIFRRYYDNLRIREEILSQTDSVWMFSYYYPNGIAKQLKTKINDREQGKSISYYESGNIKSTGIVNGFHFVGLWTWYYDNGVIQKQIDFDSLGGLNGKYVEYYNNGKIKTDAHFNQKALDKDFKEYDEEGKITQLIKYPAQSSFYNFSIGRSGPDKIQLIIEKNEK